MSDQASGLRDLLEERTEEDTRAMAVEPSSCHKDCETSLKTCRVIMRTMCGETVEL